jgi:hypothetical protein
MQIKSFNAILKPAVRLATVLLLGAGIAAAQQPVNLTAAPTSLIMSDGSSVPMWGYACGAVVTGSTATCAAANPNAGGGWSPVIITVPTGAAGGLQINLTNSLSFANGNSVPTSIMIVGQVGGGLGNSATSTTSPDHSNLPSNSVSWPIAGGAGFTPPTQGPRVQSFGTEALVGATAPTQLTWSTLRPGTYLLESGTHPSIQATMGLIGMLVVTQAPTVDPATGKTETAAGIAYPGVNYDTEVPVLMSEIDPRQNNAVSAAVNTAGFSETKVWSGAPGACGDQTPGNTTPKTCYPPVVDYTPLYYLINGVAFNKTNATGSQFIAAPVNTLPQSGTGTTAFNPSMLVHS